MTTSVLCYLYILCTLDIFFLFQFGYIYVGLSGWLVVEGSRLPYVEWDYRLDEDT